MLGAKEEMEGCHQKRFGSFKDPTRYMYTMYMVHVQSTLFTTGSSTKICYAIHENHKIICYHNYKIIIIK